MKDIFLVDADETVLDFLSDERNSLKSCLEALGIPFEERFYERFHEVNASMWKLLERGEITRPQLTVHRFEVLFEELNLSVDASSFSSAYLREIANGGVLLQGAKEFLQALRSRGRVYIVTNGSKVAQRGRFENAGLFALSDGAFISDEVGADKPSIKYAEYVEAHIPDYERKRAVWIGDSLTSDCACAKTLGIDFIWYHIAPNPDYCGLRAGNYEEVFKLIETL